MQTVRRRNQSGASVIAVVALLSLAATQTAAQVPEIGLRCGGIGLEESQAILGAEKSHALTLIFATPEGSWLAGVDTRVEDPLSDLRARAHCGPLGLVDVPAAGRYRIVATFRGETREHWVDLTPAGGARLVLRWRDE